MINLVKKIKNIFLKFSQKIPSSPFKIIGVDGTPIEKNTKIRYQVCGKSITNTEIPKNFIKDLFQIKGFSSTDSKLILSLYTEEKNSAFLRIRRIFFSPDHTEVEIEDLQNGYTTTINLLKIFEAPELVGKFSVNNVLILYHQFMNDKFRNEKITLKSNKLKKSPNLYVIKN